MFSQIFCNQEINKMASEDKKKRPPGVPEENVYKSVHWSIILAYGIAAAAIYLLLSSAS